MAHEAEIAEILTRVDRWPVADRLALARRLMTDSSTERETEAKSFRESLKADLKKKLGADTVKGY